MMTSKDIPPVGYVLPVAIGAFVGAMAGLLVAILLWLMPRLIPKMMAFMMPRMMAFMEEADVDSPCAHILKEFMQSGQGS